MSEPDATARDRLALRRTHLANERTLLAYGRTAIMLAASGVTLLKLEAIGRGDRWLAGVLIVAAVAVAATGFYRFYRTRRATDG